MCFLFIYVYFLSFSLLSRSFRPLSAFSIVKSHMDVSLMLTCSFGSTCANFAIVASPIVLNSQVNARSYFITIVEVFWH